MNDNELLNTMITSIAGGPGLTLPPISTVGTSTVTIRSDKESILDILDQHALNQFTVDHKVQEQELLKLKEVAPNYAEEIKENIAKNLARDIAKKISYTKKSEDDTHHFIGRVWVFTTEEITKLIEEARRV